MVDLNKLKDTLNKMDATQKAEEDSKLNTLNKEYVELYTDALNYIGSLGEAFDILEALEQHRLTNDKVANFLLTLRLDRDIVHDYHFVYRHRFVEDSTMHCTFEYNPTYFTLLNYETVVMRDKLLFLGKDVVAEADGSISKYNLDKRIDVLRHLQDDIRKLVNKINKFVDSL